MVLKRAQEFFSRQHALGRHRPVALATQQELLAGPELGAA